ncbi:MAG: ASKHA domain-containing protein [Promethearchaeota archaeon]
MQKSGNTNRHVLILEPISNRVDVADKTTIYNALIALHYPMGALCGGKGTCGKCIIKIIDPQTEKNCSEPTQNEIKILGKEKLMEGYRLACQTTILGDLRVYLTESLIPKGNRILVNADLKLLGIKKNTSLNPLINSRLYKIPSADLNNPRDDFSGLINEIVADTKLNLFTDDDLFQINNRTFSVAKKIPHSMRKKKGIVTAYFRKNQKKGSKIWKIFDVEAGDDTKRLFGLAVDIGTTTIVGYLINLITGETSSISAMLNPQVAIGEDLVSRITYISKNNANEKVKDMVVEAINKILTECCIKAGISSIDVKDIVIVGNTGMHHMFFGIPTKYLALSPYVPVFKAPINIRAGSLGLICGPNVNVYSPPVIAGYVGTDTIGCIISSKINVSEKYSLLIDIGTNGELVMGNKNRIATASCAAGSALEGAHIIHGMRASKGAIEAVSIDPKTLEPSLGIIGNTEPMGICGSGLIDTIAEMLKSNIISRSGRFNIKSKELLKNRRVVKKIDGYHYILYKPKWDAERTGNLIQKTDTGQEKYKNPIKEITISQEDVNQLQLAKGAFLSAARLLLNEESKKESDLERIILAGGFGTYINKENAAFIGLFPEVNGKNIFQIGNAAGMGAQLCLKDVEQRDLANDIAFKIKYHEIASLKRFQKEYAFSLYFPYYTLDDFPSLKESYENIQFR